jgi:hypothetical protein
MGPAWQQQQTLILGQAALQGSAGGPQLSTSLQSMKTVIMKFSVQQQLSDCYSQLALSVLTQGVIIPNLE